MLTKQVHHQKTVKQLKNSKIRSQNSQGTLFHLPRYPLYELELENDWWFLSYCIWTTIELCKEKKLVNLMVHFRQG